MKYNIMITSLFDGRPEPSIDYYYADDLQKPMYCDALLAAEASSKYILANYHIDEIITLGSKSSYDPGDEVKQMVLREGSSFYSSDINSLSTYSLLRYRLAQYIDEITIDAHEIRELLDEKQQNRIKEVFKAFFREHVQSDTGVKFNRLFDVLRSDEELRDTLYNLLLEAVPEIKEDKDRYRQWILNYLYDELKDSFKLELLDGNEDVKIVFVPTDENGALSFADTLSCRFREMKEEAGEDLEIELYICILSEDADDSFALMNFMDVVKSMPSAHVTINKIATATRRHNEITSTISDATELYGTTELLTGTRAFLRYGKTDLLVDYWNKQGIENLYIERLLHAMRNIDIGISLCDIQDIERGINSLRTLFDEGDFVPGNNIVERYFDVIVDGIKVDYGELVTGDKVEFIDLVKWAYRKGFWQQTLTIIESRAPADFVDRGIYYYMDDEIEREQIVEILGTIFFNLKSFEKYKMDDLSHYFIKFYGRDRTDRSGPKDSMSIQKAYTRTRMSDLDTEDPEIICAHTNCMNRDDLSGLLFAYYMIGEVRNRTNHAESDMNDEFTRMKDADVSERMNMIKHAVESFIEMYDKVTSEMYEEPKPVLFIGNPELRAYAQTLRQTNDRKRDDRK